MGDLKKDIDRQNGKFISFENESPEFNTCLRSLKERELTTSEIILLLLEEDGELFCITK